MSRRQGCFCIPGTSEVIQFGYSSKKTFFSSGKCQKSSLLWRKKMFDFFFIQPDKHIEILVHIGPVLEFMWEIKSIHNFYKGYLLT